MRKWLLFILIAVMPAGLLLAQSAELRRTQFNVHRLVALEGYDPVSYFNGKPTEGVEKLRSDYKGITYLFKNEANLARFKANPASFEPAYGGWCAYAMGKNGEKVKIDPETFKIKDGTLYLFYNFWGNNTLKDWNLDEKKLKTQGDLYWAKFVQ
jgi:YHS domain-containing protein